MSEVSWKVLGSVYTPYCILEETFIMVKQWYIIIENLKVLFFS